MSSKTGLILIAKPLLTAKERSSGSAVGSGSFILRNLIEGLIDSFAWFYCAWSGISMKSISCIWSPPKQSSSLAGMFTGPAALPLLQEEFSDRVFMRRITTPKELSLPSFAFLSICQQDRWARKTSDRTTTNPQHLGIKRTQNPLPHLSCFVLLFFFSKSIYQGAEIITSNKCLTGWINQLRALWDYIDNNNSAQHNLPEFHTQN